MDEKDFRLKLVDKSLLDTDVIGDEQDSTHHQKVIHEESQDDEESGDEEEQKDMNRFSKQTFN